MTTPGPGDIVAEVTNLARAFASVELPAEDLANWTEDDWHIFEAGVNFGQAATIFVFQRHGVLPSKPEDPQ